MHDFLTLAEARRSIRAFSREPIEFADVVDAIRAASYAPSAGDLQPWKFIIITDDERRQRLSGACPKQDWLLDAPLIIVVCSEHGRVEDFYPGEGEKWALQSCAAATQNLLLAATERGLASTWVGMFDAEEVRDILKIPDGVRPEALVALGHGERPAELKRVDPLDSQVYFNTYGTVTEDMESALKDWGAHYRKKVSRVREELKAGRQGAGGRTRESLSRFKAKAKDLLGR